MGNVLHGGYAGKPMSIPEADYPDNKAGPTFDPNGDERPVKVKPKATVAEMENARVPRQFRNYCVDHYIAWKKCKFDNFPTLYKCDEIYEHWNHCLMLEKHDQSREYERERRLLERKKKKELRDAAAGVENVDDSD